MSRSIIVELAEQAPNSIRLANGDYSVRLPEPIMIEKGDQVSLKSAFIDNVSAGSGDINVIPDVAKGSQTTVSLKFGYYAVDWGSSNKDESSTKIFKPIFPNADGSGGVPRVGGQPTADAYILNRPINNPSTESQKLTDFQFTWDKTHLDKGERTDGLMFIQVTFEVVGSNGAFDGSVGMSFNIGLNGSDSPVNSIFDLNGGDANAPPNRITLNAAKWRKYVDNGIIQSLNGLTEDGDMFKKGGTDNLFPIIVPSSAILGGAAAIFKPIIYNRNQRHKGHGGTVNSPFGCVGVQNNLIYGLTFTTFGGDETLAEAYTQRVQFTIPSGAYAPADLTSLLTSKLTDLNLESVDNPASLNNDYTYNKNPLLKTIRQLMHEDNFVSAPIFYSQKKNQSFTYVTGKDLPAEGADQTPAINFFTGTSEFGITYDNMLEKVELQQIHSSLYGKDGVPQVRFFKHGVDTDIAYANKNTGIYLIDMQPENLWFESGLKLPRSMLTKINTVQGYEGVGGDPPAFVGVTFDVANELIDGRQMTGDVISLDGLITKKGTGSVEDGNLTFPIFDEPPTFAPNGGDNIPSVLVNTGQTVSIVATDTIGQGKIDVNSIEKAGGYFKIEVGMPSILPEVRGGEGKSNRISSIISKFNSIGSYTSSYSEGSIPYYYNSEVPTYLSEFNVRVLEADGALSTKLGSCSAVFLEIIKPLPLPPK